jgi:fructose-1,6-bisphosphatase I
MNESLALPVGVTLDRFIMKNQEHFPFATGELSQLLRDIALAGKIISTEIRRAGLSDVTGALGSQNVQGESQQKLDVIANIRFIRALRNGGQVCAIISEEEDELIITENNNSKYVVAIDPLDGSSNIDVNISVGTIFSVYRRVTPIGTIPTMEDVLQQASKQVASGYIMYGPSTVFVYTTGRGVNGFTYDTSFGEFFLSHQGIVTKQDGNIYSCNESNMDDFPSPVKDYLNQCRKDKYTSRYTGSLVADFHRNLMKGGIYLFPPTVVNPKGKLRLLYECFPLAYLIEQAGGTASDGINSIMDIVPTDIHQRSALYIGSPDMVEKVEGMFRGK